MKRRTGGLVTVRKTLSDGTVKAYHYPRARYLIAEDPDAIAWLSSEYKKSAEWQRHAPATRSTYDIYLHRLSELLVDSRGKPLKLSAMNTKGVRAIIYRARDKVSAKPSAANMMVSVLSILLDWAVDREILDFNPAQRIKRFPVESRADKFLTAEQEAEILSRADPDESRIIRMALYTGLREGDLCNLTAAHVSNGWLVVTPQKTQRLKIRVSIPIAEYSPLEALLGTLPTSGYLLTRKGEKWHKNTLQDRWATLRRKVDSTLHFHDLRGTLATRLGESGCTAAEQNAVLGKKLAVGSLGDYLGRTRKLSVNAYRKLALWTPENQTAETDA